MMINHRGAVPRDLIRREAGAGSIIATPVLELNGLPSMAATSLFARHAPPD
jgi:hypothetical protein